jgi:hypothetical protein
MDATVENKALPVLRSAIRRVLAPLVKILLRHGISYQVFTDEAKRVFIQVAEQEFSLQGRKQSAARVAILTGISRKEISRLQNSNEQQQEVQHSFNRAARVISAWVSDSQFQSQQGHPMELPIDGDTPSFGDLVRKSSGDMLVRAMLDELVRVGAVEVVDKRARLVNRSYVPAQSETEKLRILGTDVASLIETISHNLENSNEGPFFQRKVYYDNLPAEALPEIRTLTRRHGQELIELMDKLIQTHDRDVNPEVEGAGRYMAGIGIYYFENSSAEEKQS